MEPETQSDPIPIFGVAAATLPSVLERLPASAGAFARAHGFKGESGDILVVPGPSGEIAAVLFGTEADAERRVDPFLAGPLATKLPAGRYRFAEGFADPYLAALGFELSAYRFTRYRKAAAAHVHLDAPAGIDAARLSRTVAAVARGRDLVNRPANDLGPGALTEAIRELADTYGAQLAVIDGDDLARDFPMIHAVGRAASEPPRLADLVWGQTDAPKVTLVGKGVCFDTGGLNIKPDAAMLLMKKDMGGAASAIALAEMIMAAQLPVRLRLLVPIVENSIAGNAFRPGDVLRSRKGLTVEIGNTDAEGRLILADALALASEETPELLLDFATLTGAARVALGPDLPPFYTMDEGLAGEIAAAATAANDPCWRMPLWDPYETMLKSKIADLNNVSGGSFAGSVTAALFLRRFVGPGIPWVHCDVYGWNPTTKPGRPEGGEVQMARAFAELLEARYGHGA